MGRIADVLNELTLLGAVGSAEPATPVVAPAPTPEDEPEVVEDYDPVALLTAGFKAPLEDAEEDEGAEDEEGEDDSGEGEDEDDEGDTDEEESEDSDEEEDDADETSLEEEEEPLSEDEASEEDDSDEDSEEEVDLAPVVSKLLKDVEAMAEQMNSVLWAVRELDALLKGE